MGMVTAYIIKCPTCNSELWSTKRISITLKKQQSMHKNKAKFHSNAIAPKTVESPAFYCVKCEQGIFGM